MLEVRDIKMNKIQLLPLKFSLEDREPEQTPYLGAVGSGTVFGQ